MNWSEPAFILCVRPFAEHDALISLFARGTGRYSGLVKGGQSSRQRTSWQPGLLVNATWRARLTDQLGLLSGEPLRDYAGGLLQVPLGLAALMSALALVESLTAERMAYPALYDALEKLLPLDDGADDMARYVHFECALLKALGYGLDLGTCALTASTRDLAYVSPKTGRAVTRLAGAPWAQKLLPLPPFLTSPALPGWDELHQGLDLTGYFIARNLASHLGAAAQQRLAERRQRLTDLVIKRCAGEEELVGSRQESFA